MKAWWGIVCVAVVGAVMLGLAACQGGIKIDPDPTARAFYQAIHDGDLARVRALATPELSTPKADAEIMALQRFIPAEPPREVKGLGRNLTAMANAGQTLATTDIYDFGTRKALVNASMRRATSADPWKVQGFNIRVFTEKDMASQAFTLEGKPLQQPLFLLATVGFPLLMIAALVKVVRQPGLKRKWLWGIVAFVGVASFHMDWTTGLITFQLVSVQLIGAGVMTAAPGLTPWMLTFTLPIGAVLILAGVLGNPARSKSPPQDPAETF